MEPLNPALNGPGAWCRSFHSTAGLMAHGDIERPRATVTTELIVILVFAVSIHFPDHGVPIHSLLRHPPR